MDNTSIEKFNQEAREIMVAIAKHAKQKKVYEAHDKAMRAQLLELCEKHGVDSIDNDFVKISRVKGSETKSVDLKKVQTMDPALYDDLLNEYPKVTRKSAYLRITPKLPKEDVDNDTE